MRNFKWLFLVLFTAKVTMPMGPRVAYYDVQSVKIEGFAYVLTLFTGKTVYVPIMFTVIEEQR